MDTQLAGYVALGILVQSLILYFVIKLAVNDALFKGMNEIIKQLKLINQFKVRELGQNGVSNAEIQKDIDIALK
jgi:hypothetical protein